MAFLAPFIPLISAGLGLVSTLLVLGNRPKTPAMPPPVAPPRPPVRISQTAAQQRATLLTKPTGSGGGMSAAAIGAGSSGNGPMLRPALLGR